MKAHSKFDVVECSEILTRILANSKHIDSTGNVTAAAFILRAKDKGRLSVFRQRMINVEESKAILHKPKGAVSLHAGHVRALNQVLSLQVDVVPAEGEGTDLPGHAAIIGLPDPLIEPITAERAATLLRDKSRKAG